MFDPAAVMFVISITSFVGTTLTFVWRLSNAVAAMKQEARTQITQIDFDRQINDERLVRLQSGLDLECQRLRARLEYSCTQSFRRHKEQEIRLRQIENFLLRTYPDREL